MSNSGRGHFDGQRWWKQMINTRTNEALAHLPPEERRLRYGAEHRRQEALYRQERDEKKRAKIQRNKERQRMNQERQLKNAEARAEAEKEQQVSLPKEEDSTSQ